MNKRAETPWLIVAWSRQPVMRITLRRLSDSTELRARLGQQRPARAIELCDPGGRIPDLHQALLQH